ncbi:MAG: diacylglycerol kinase family protein [Chitinophagales bacterium]
MFKKEIKSFGDAMNGLLLFFKTEWHARLHLLAVVVVTIAGFYFEINSGEWVAVLIAFALVIGSELLNTAIEKLCDFVQPENHSSIRQIKHISAGAVLFSAVIALIIACIIFIPKII